MRTFTLALALLLAGCGGKHMEGPRTLDFMAGDLVKGTLPAVYYIGADGKRYVFVNDKCYFTWYPDFSGVMEVSDSELATIPIGGNVTYRPGVKMVKLPSDPRTYAVAHGGVLRWVKSQTLAEALYGSGWNAMIDDLSDVFFVNYSIGSDIVSASDYSVMDELVSSPTIDVDKGIMP